MSEIFDGRRCCLGEGALWHPVRKQLFWFDIINRRLLSRVDDTSEEWHFDRMVSAAGWIDYDNLLIATEFDLIKFNIVTKMSDRLVSLESDNPVTRSNDGRADPLGGFWVGTMGKNAEDKAGSIYRYFKGELRKIHDAITIPNSICFSPNGDRVYFADTVKQTIWSQLLGNDGWPVADPEVFVDLTAKGLFPDGSVIDSDGCLWNAQWGSGSVARYSSSGEFLERIYVGGAHSSCPAFGGNDNRTLFVTTAREGIDQPSSSDGAVYAKSVNATGTDAPCVLIP